ncbi:MAG: hypothetical protein LPK07_06755 [Hymenobacteraceae bacterium]|nr:hypothetical protein [Hymenobacteraceae bacterium]MDX5481365.1 hypothetical protein [Hymenobacteraceae bacterium]
MRHFLVKGLLVLLVAATVSSCSSTRRHPGSSDRVIIINKGKQVRVEDARKDNGLHRGWYKNSHNPHHPHTTNPGHTKHKGKPGKGGKHGKGKKH